MRFSRDEDGNIIYVPSDISYKDWKKKFVKSINISEDNDDDLIRNTKFAEAFNIREVISDITNIIKDIPNEKIRLLLEKHLNNGIEVDEDFRIPFAYIPVDNKVKLNPYHSDFKYYDVVESIVHELGHKIDYNLDIDKKQKEIFNELVAKENKKFVKSFDKYTKLKDDDKYYYNMPLSDILSALSNGKLRMAFSHDEIYFSYKELIVAEVFANMFSAYCTKNTVALDFLKTKLPELYEVFKNLF